LTEALVEEYLSEQYDILLEKLITFGGQAYPKFGNIVIMAGGAGSGKGFILSKLVGIEGKTFDVDQLKGAAAKAPAIQARIKSELGLDIEKIGSDLKKPENVAKMHQIVGDYLDLDNRVKKSLYRGILLAHPDRKPNLVFDVTLKDLRKLETISRQAQNLGYAKENIHIVWVVNDIEVAKSQNLRRSRTVPTEILVNTHRGASQTMLDIVSMGKTLKKYMDGDIVFAFNKVGVDSTISKSGKGGMYVKDANYFYVKRKNKEVTPADKLDKTLRMKIKSYVPANSEWL
jgi:hypothetical protein